MGMTDETNEKHTRVVSIHCLKTGLGTIRDVRLDHVRSWVQIGLKLILNMDVGRVVHGTES